MQKRISKRKSNNPGGKKRGFALPPGTFFTSTSLAKVCPRVPPSRATGCASRAPGGAPTFGCVHVRERCRAGASCTREAPAGIASLLRGSGVGCCPPPSPSVELQPWRRPSEPPHPATAGAPPRPVREVHADWSKQELQQVTVRTSLSPLLSLFPSDPPNVTALHSRHRASLPSALDMRRGRVGVDVVFALEIKPPREYGFEPSKPEFKTICKGRDPFLPTSFFPAACQLTLFFASIKNE